MKGQDTIYVYPTDTVWGMGSSIYSRPAYAEILRIKNYVKPRPLSVLFFHYQQVLEFFNLPSFVREEWLKDFFKIQGAVALSALAYAILKDATGLVVSPFILESVS